jgi:ParB/RepB/Spo0J family partition protein
MTFIRRLTNLSTETKSGARGLAESTFTGLHVDPRKIKVEKGFNPRDFSNPENVESVRELANSIKAAGLKTPLIVRFKDNDLWLVDGERRLRAIMLLVKEGVEFKTVKATLEDKNVSEDQRLASVFEYNNQSKPLTQLEVGELFARLKGYGWTDEQIAERRGITPTHVGNIMMLHAAPPAVKKVVNDGKISSTLALELIRDHGDKASAVIKETIANAEQSGKDHATKKHVTAEAPAKKKRNGKVDPLAFNRTQGKQMFAAMSEIYFDREIERPAVLRVIRDVFSDIIGSDWQKVAKDYLKSLDDEE